MTEQTVQPTETRYLSEIISYGGERMTRGEMIADLQRIAPNQAFVDRYLQGHDR
jgi:hypothetical protein